MKNPLPPAPVPRILIVDDEIQVRKFLRLGLQAEKFNVLEAATAEQALTLVHTAAPDLMILDLGLPDLDGRQVIRDVRLTSSMPILVLSGRTEDSEKIAALEHGADDYMTKPFAMHDLVLRVQRAVSSSRTTGKRNKSLPRDHVQTGDLVIHLALPEVKRGSTSVELTTEEYSLLRLLAMHGGRVLTYDHLEQALWGTRDDNGRRNLQKRIATLRRKLEDEPSFPRYIVTEASIGHRLEMLPVTN
jgi:two-component system KDP operon response regulator KdpE